MDFTTFGFELIANDLSKIASAPRIAGARVVIRPAAPTFPLGFGLSAIADFNPAEGLNLPTGGITADMIGNPMFFAVGADIDYPHVKSDQMNLIAFADFGGMMPYFQTQGSGAYSSITPGLHTEAMFSSEGFKNFGLSTGVLGNMSIFTYQLEFRYFTGTFTPGFMNKTYDRSSADLALLNAQYIQNPADPLFDKTTLGVYGEGGIKFENICSFTVGYLFPMTLDAAGFAFGEGDDVFHMQFVLEPKIIPVVNLSGSISYDRNFLVSMLLGRTSETGKKLGFLDEYSVLSGEIVYGISKGMDLAFILATCVARDSSGAIIYESDGITEKIGVTWAIETRIHF
jgi:hypothetical protein